MQTDREKLLDSLDYVMKIVEVGAKKHGAGTWMDPTNPSMEHTSNHNSMFHHLADSYARVKEDHESGLDPLAHLACRALMELARRRHGITS